MDNSLFNKDIAKKYVEAQKAKMKAIGHVPNYLSLVNRHVSIAVPYPLGIRQKMEAEGAFGPPEGWDYQTATADWQGNELPEGAKGWTPNGEAWYGGENAFDEWKKRNAAMDKLNISSGSAEEAWDFVLQKKEESDRKFMSGDYLGSMLAGAQYGFGAVSAAYRKLIGSNPEGEQMTPLQKASERIGDLIRGGYSWLLRIPEIFEEEVFSRTQGLEDVANTSELAPIGLTQEERNANLQKWNVYLADVANPTLAKNLTDLSRFFANMVDLNPVSVAWNMIRYAAAPGTGEEKFQAVQRRVEAGRVLYSSWVDEAITNQYLQRVKNGEDPYLVQLAVQRPEFEAIGQAILDPLNFVDLVAKGLGLGKKVTNLAEFVGTSAAKGFRGIDKLDEVAAASKIESSIDEIIEITGKAENMLANSVPPDDIGFIRKGLNRILNTNRFTGYTEAAKAWHLERLGTDMSRQIIAVAGKDPDAVLDIMKGWMMISSQNAAEVKRGLSIVGQYIPIEMATSQGGLRYSMMLREMMTFDGALDIARFGKEVRGITDAGELMGFYAKRMEQASKRIFPELNVRLEAFRAAEKAVKEGTMTIEEAQKIKGLTAFDRFYMGVDKFSNNKFMANARAFYARVFMGANPGYAFKNWTTNTVHILADVGPGAYFENGRYLTMAEVERQLDEISKGAVTVMSDVGFTKADVGVVGKSDTLLGKLDTLKWSGRMESAAGKRIILKSYKDTLRKMVPVMLERNRGLLTAAGMSVDDISHLEKLITQNWGDVNKALDIFKAERRNGFYNLFASGRTIPDEVWKVINDFELDGAIRHVLSQETAEDARRVLQEIFDEVRKKADSSGLITPTESAVDGMDFMGEMEGTIDAINNIPAPESIRAAAIESVHANRVSDLAFGDLKTDLMLSLKNKYGILDDGTIVDIATEGARSMTGDDLIGFVSGGDPRVADTVRQILDNTYHEPINQMYREKFYGAWSSISRKLESGKMTVAQAVNEIPMLKGFGLENLGEKQFRDILWNHFFPLQSRRWWMPFRDEYAETVSLMFRKLGDAGVDVSQQEGLLKLAVEKLRRAEELDTSFIRDLDYDGLIQRVAMSPQDFENTMSVQLLGYMNGIPTATSKGVPTPRLLNTINKELRSIIPDFVDYKHIDEIPLDAAAAALKNKYGDGFVGFADEIPAVGDFSPLQHAAQNGPEMFSGSAAPHRWESALPKLEKVESILNDVINTSFNSVQEIAGNEADFAEALKKYAAAASKDELHVRMTANEVSVAYRNFALHDYNSKRGFDAMLNLIFPYQFWYSRTYAKWIQRLASHPGLITAYGAYREALAQIHAGQPDWWKYNVNSSELLGIFPDHPLFFNLEATLNPLNGLTGVDFEDPYKRIDFWTKSLDDLGRWGPSTHPLLNLGMALSLKKDGEDDAAARWGGRLFPQTQVIEAIDALVGDDEVESRDPFVNLFSGGTDPYTERRVGRALSQMILDGKITEAEAIDAAYNKEGPIWEQARTIAIRDRGWGNISSFFLGVGFKARNQGDLLTDQMYSEFFRMMNMKDTMDPERFRMEMTNLATKYPFMDTVMISAKLGPDRDSAYAYSVLGRIPPGASSEFYKAAGIDGDLVSKFYDSKGDFSEWAESDRMRFMSAIIDLAATLDIPPTYTQEMWDAAKSAYGTMIETMKSQYGDDIMEKIDVYFEYKTAGDTNAADLFLETHPEVGKALDFRTAVILSNEYMAPYYSSTKTIRGYYYGQMIQEAKQKFGNDILQLQDQYYSLPPNQRAAFRRKNPRLVSYWEFKREMNESINRMTAMVYAGINAPLPASIRADADLVGYREQIAMAAMESGTYDKNVNYDSLEYYLSQIDYSLLTDVQAYAYSGTISKRLREALDEIAYQNGVPPELYLNVIMQQYSGVYE